MIASLYAGILGLLFFIMSLETILARRSKRISVGVGSQGEIAQIVSAHSNFSSYSIYLLFLVFLLERNGGASGFILHVVAIVFTAGRICHYIAFRKKMNFSLRVIGMQATLWPLLILSVLNVYYYWAS